MTVGGSPDGQQQAAPEPPYPGPPPPYPTPPYAGPPYAPAPAQPYAGPPYAPAPAQPYAGPPYAPAPPSAAAAYAGPPAAPVPPYLTLPATPLPPWWEGLRPTGGELNAIGRLVGLLALTGIPLGILWRLIAPRREYLVSAEGAFAIVPESEAAVGSDGLFMLLLGILALAATALAWRLVRHRGPLVAVGLAAGLLLCGLVTWTVGSLLAAGPSAADLADVGATVLGPLGLRAQGALVVGPFLAVAAYTVFACFTPHDDLRRAPRSRWSVGGPGDAQLDQRDGDRAQAADEQ